MKRISSVTADPANWYRMMREQVSAHKEASKHVLATVTTDEADNVKAMQHWFAGSLLAIDLLVAADAYIAALAEEHRQSKEQFDAHNPHEIPGHIRDAFPANLPWSRCRRIAFEFASPMEE